MKQIPPPSGEKSNNSFLCASSLSWQRYNAQVQFLPLHHAAVGAATILHDAPVPVCLAILVPLDVTEKHIPIVYN